jgi:Uma2 family endonuclease
MKTAARKTIRQQTIPWGELTEPIVLFPMTSDDFCELPVSETVKLELLDGEVVALPKPTRDHQYFLLQLAIVIDQWAKAKKLGRVLPDVLMKLDGKWTPAPDLVFVATEHLHLAKKKRIEGPVDLAVEILSSKPEVDRVVKFDAYARYGVPWYWIVDLEQRILEEYRLVRKQYRLQVEAAFDKPFTPRLFPGLTIDLASLEWQAL